MPNYFILSGTCTFKQGTTINSIFQLPSLYFLSSFHYLPSFTHHIPYLGMMPPAEGHKKPIPKGGGFQVTIRGQCSPRVSELEEGDGERK